MELTAHPFFKTVRQDSLEKLKSTADVSEFNDGQIIFEEGATSNSLFLLLDGNVAFHKKMQNGDYMTVSRTTAGSYFGEIGILTGQKRSLRAVAEGRALLARIPGDDLVEYIRNIPGPIEEMMAGIINHLKDTTQHYINDMVRQEKMATIGQMVNTIVHDFKNPFTVIITAAQLIKTRHDDPQTQKFCKNIEDQIARMVEMAGEIGDFARGNQSLKATRVNLKHLLGHFRELNYPYFENEKVEIHIEVPDIIIEAEPQKLLRVLQNLVSNAISAFEDEGGKLSITGRTLHRNRTLELKVEDNGLGIPEIIRDNFFEPFVTHGKAQGTGLGAAIVKSIVEAHGGSIKFTTEAGKGTTFTIRIPTKQPKEKAS